MLCELVGELRGAALGASGGPGHDFAAILLGRAFFAAAVLLGRAFTAGAADGFNILFPTLPGALNDFIELVIPELQRRGLFRTAYEGTTLRENLGLPQPD